VADLRISEGALAVFNPVWSIVLSLVVLAVFWWLISRPHVLLLLKLGFFARYSLLIALLLVLLAPLAWWWFPALLGAVLVMDNVQQMAVVVFLSLCVAEMTLVTFRICQLNAPTRFAEYQKEVQSIQPTSSTADGTVAPVTKRDWWRDLVRQIVTPPSDGLGWWCFLWLLLLGLPLPMACIIRTAQEAPSALTLVGGPLLGLLAFLLLQVIISAGQRWLLPRDGVVADLFRPDLWLRNSQSSTDAPTLQPVPSWFWDRIARLLCAMGPGYAETTTENGREVFRLRPGHAQLALAWAVLLSLYGAVYLAGSLAGPPTEGTGFSALASLLTILLVSGLTLSGLTFLFDYLRVPAEVLVASLILLLWLVNQTDHHYQLADAQETQQLQLLDVYETNWQFPRLKNRAPQGSSHTVETADDGGRDGLGRRHSRGGLDGTGPRWAARALRRQVHAISGADQHCLRRQRWCVVLSRSARSNGREQPQP
jgi:hypothetical protein